MVLALMVLTVMVLTVMVLATISLYQEIVLGKGQPDGLGGCRPGAS
jgi:hypothetical protein